MIWRGMLGMNGSFPALCNSSKVISWVQLFKFGSTKPIYNYCYNRLSSRLGSSFSSASSSSSSSSSSGKCNYEHLFPSFYDGYVSHRIEWFYSNDPPHHPCRHEIDLSLKNLLDKGRMDLPHLEKRPQLHYEFDDDVSIEFQRREGRHLHVIPLLSTHGDQLIRIGATDSNKTVKAECLRGKYILICCAAIPFLWMDDEARHFRKLSLLASEMSQTRRDFEIVIVACMRSREWDDEGVFDHFFSAFPGCLVVPFHHKYRREYICKSLCFLGFPKSILLNPSQKVIKSYEVNYFVEYGARGFPFTIDHLRLLSSQDKWGVPCAPDPPSCNTSLAGLLSCGSDPTSLLLRKLNSEETISVEQLNKHHVGLYLFNQGDLLKQIHQIYQQCRDERLDFEIVLVPLPYGYSIHPQDFHDIVCNVLDKFQITNWWIIPFNHSLYLRLYNLSGGNRGYCPGSDAMIIVGPHNSFVNEKAGKVIYHYNLQFGTQMHPFTLEALFQAFLQRFGNITLESFLLCDHLYQDYECDDSKTIHVSELRGKNVIVYMDIPSCLGPPWTRYGQVVKLYNKIKKIDSEFELVFVPSLFPVPESEFQKLYSKARECIFESKMKWRVCPISDPEHLVLLQKNDAIKLIGDSCLPFSVMAFGKDGHVHSLDVLELFHCHGDDAYPFIPESKNKILRDEISRVLPVF